MDVLNNMYLFYQKVSVTAMAVWTFIMRNGFQTHSVYNFLEDVWQLKNTVIGKYPEGQYQSHGKYPVGTQCPGYLFGV